MNHTKKLLLLAAAGVGVAGLSSAGWAYWSASGSGSASASVGTLNAPTAVTAPAGPLPSPVNVSWAAPTTGAAPSGYYVERFSGATLDGPACESAATTLLPATPASCSDTAVNDGTYTYQVTAVFASWTAVSQPSASVTVVNDSTPPTVSSINRLIGANHRTSSASVSWTVTFSEPVTGVDTNDFHLAQDAGVSGASVTSFSGSGTTYTVSANTGTGDGTLGLNLVDDNSIVDAAAHRLGGPALDGEFTGQEYVIDKTAPAVVSINRVNTSPTNADIVSWTVTFSESVAGADTTDFSLAVAGLSGASITSASGESFTVTASTGTGEGTLGLNLMDNDSIVDAAGNELVGEGGMLNGNFTGQVYSIDKTRPTVAVDQKIGQADPTRNLPILYTVSFSEPVTGFEASDLTRTGTSTAGIISLTGSGANYEISVDPTPIAPANGTIGFTVGAGATRDLVGNENLASTSTDNTVTIDTLPPTATINQSVDQADPTNSSTITFTVVFSEPVIGFSGSDIVLGGTAGLGGALKSVTGAGPTYTVAVSGLTGNGTVIAGIAAGSAHDFAGNSNEASTSTDNTVTLDRDAPSSTALVLQNKAGGIAGRLEQGDKVQISFTEQLRASSICSSWTDNASGVQSTAGVTVHVSNTEGANVVSLTQGSGCTVHFGMIDLGTGYVTSSGRSNKPADFSSSTVTYDGTGRTITITLGTVVAGSDQGTLQTVASSVAKMTFDPAITDLAGNALTPADRVTGNVQQF